MDHLDELEAEAIYIMREVWHMPGDAVFDRQRFFGYAAFGVKGILS